MTKGDKNDGTMAKKGKALDPRQFTAPVVLDAVEVQVVLQVLAQTPLQGTAEHLEAVLPVIRSARSKLVQALQVIQTKMPKEAAQ